LVFRDAPGSYEICPLCFWEDDLVQLRWPNYGGGANRPSLIEAQANVRRYGAMESRFKENVRPPHFDEPLDPEWRAFDPSRDDVEDCVSGHDYGDSYHDDRTTYYYWRRSDR
jgi:hypothetical protein